MLPQLLHWFENPAPPFGYGVPDQMMVADFHYARFSVRTALLVLVLIGLGRFSRGRSWLRWSYWITTALLFGVTMTKGWSWLIEPEEVREKAPLIERISGFPLRITWLIAAGVLVTALLRRFRAQWLEASLAIWIAAVGTIALFRDWQGGATALPCWDAYGFGFTFVFALFCSAALLLSRCLAPISALLDFPASRRRR